MPFSFSIMRTTKLVLISSVALVALTALWTIGGVPSLRAHDAPATAAPAYPPRPGSPKPVVPTKAPPRVKELLQQVVPGEQLDEPLAGRTLLGSPVAHRIPECFPAEQRDLFWQMDMVASGENGALEPLNFDVDGDGKISNTERHAIRGRNTWLLWGAGNEAFWGWLQERGYGITDFLILMDSRDRAKRFEKAGLISQPGLAGHSDASKRILGLYLDTQTDQTVLKQPWWDVDEAGHLAQRPEPPGQHPTKLFPTDGATVPIWNANGEIERDANGKERTQPLEDFVQQIQKQLAKDGVDYSVYGYPSGIFGLRLFLNPDFFSNAPGADRARRYWAERVMRTNNAYYTNKDVHADPALVRPFRVSMSCGFCHVGPHPLNPPLNPADPKWENLSSNIGAQYWNPQSAFGNLLTPDSFLYHFLKSQAPGTIDTSLVSTDQINNANTINAVFNLPARLQRALLNPPEIQSPANLLVPSIEDRDASVNPRHTPRVLVDGADSIGAFGALARVYLNIGTFWEQWETCHNPLIGFTRQRPFELRVCQKNSVYWQVNEKYRTEYLAAWFTFQRGALPADKWAAYDEALGKVKGLDSKFTPAADSLKVTPSKGAQSSTQPMKLRDAGKPAAGSAAPVNPDTEKVKALMEAKGEAQKRIAGREVWLDHCAICHSSKQPQDYGLAFARKVDWTDWGHAPVPKAGAPLVLPMDGAFWEDYKRSPAYTDYKTKLRALVKQGGELDQDPWVKDHPFWVENFLANEIRIPVTLVGTNSGRSVATNGLRGEIWDNFSSETYKNLPAVGAVRFYNPFTNATPDALGNNDEYYPPGNGPGYYRPATHISLWATAPFLHNNTLGLYNNNPSVHGRVVAFEDAMRRMLWNSKRRLPTPVLPPGLEVAASIPSTLPITHPGDLRATGGAASEKDPGYIYRLPLDTYFEFAPAYTRQLIEGVAGPGVTKFLAVWVWVILFLVLAFVAWHARPRYAGFMLVFMAVVLATLLAATGLGGGGTLVGVVLAAISNLLHFSSWMWWLLVALVGSFGFLLLFVRERCDKLVRWLNGAIGVALVVIVALATKSWLWTILVLAAVGWWVWRTHWTLRQFARIFFVTLTILVAVTGWAANRFINGQPLARIPGTSKQLGPFGVKAGPLPRGLPVNLMMNMNPESDHFPQALVAVFSAIAKIQSDHLTGDRAWAVFRDYAGAALLKASKCPDFVLDRGHWFGEALKDDEKEALIAFLKTL